MTFLSAFVSYLVLMIVFVLVGAVAITLGICLRKKKNETVYYEQVVSVDDSADV